MADNRRIVCGIVNTQSTCYANTLIQCIRACPNLVAVFKHMITKEEHRRPSLAHAFSNLIIEMDKVADGHVVQPNTFLKTFAETVPFMDVFTQNDLHEAFMVIWNRMNEDVATKRATPALRPNTGDTLLLGKLRMKCEASWWKMLGHEYSPLVEAVYGQQIIQIECGYCKYIHHNYQPFNVLEVPIPAPAPLQQQKQQQQQPTLADCLRAGLQLEVLNSGKDNTTNWTCSKCKQTVPSEKTCHIWKTPPTLIICLKRFVPFNGRSVKNDTPVQVPDTLHMYPLSERTPTSSIPATYQLMAVGHHVGALSFGHYFAHCNFNGEWKNMNDTNIRAVSKAERHQSTASSSYMLFYELG